MTQWIAVATTEHVDSYYLPRNGYAFAVNQAVANV